MHWNSSDGDTDLSDVDDGNGISSYIADVAATLIQRGYRRHVGSFARPTDYDSDTELQAFFDADDPTGNGFNGPCVFILTAGSKRSELPSLESRTDAAMEALVNA